MPNGFGLIVLGELATHCLEENDAENKYMEGLCPERILLSEDWLVELTETKIESAKAPHTSYAYYPNEYLQGKPWTTACTSFAIFSIAYKLLTGELPYIGKLPEELLSSKEALKFIKKKRKESILDLSKIPPTFAEFFIKGLAIKKNDRYQAIGDTADEFSELCEKVKGDEFLYQRNDIQSADGHSQSEFEKMLAQSFSSDFLLEVQ